MNRLKIHSSIFHEFGNIMIFYTITIFRIRPFQAPFGKIRHIWIIDEIPQITSPKEGSLSPITVGRESADFCDPGYYPSIAP